MNHTWDLSKEDQNRLSATIIKSLDGVPISQALHVLKYVEKLICDSHVISADNQRLLQTLKLNEPLHRESLSESTP